MSTKPIITTNPDFFSGDLPLAPFAAIIKTMRPLIEKSRIPILGCISLEFKGKTCTISHHGLDRIISTTIQADAPGTGHVIIPVNRLAAFLAAATGPTITLRKKKDESPVVLIAGRLTASIIPHHASDLPVRQWGDDVAPARAFDFAEGVFSSLLEFVCPSISTEETRYYLNGVCFEVLDGEVLAVTTDGHRLATRTFKTVAPLAEWDERPIVPRDTISAVRKLVTKAEGRVEFYKKGNEVVFVLKAEGWTLKSRTIDGTFPAWRRVVPEGAVSFIEIASLDIKRFASLANAGGGSPHARNSLAIEDTDGDGINFGYTVEASDAFAARIDAKVTGKPFQRFGVNIRYLSAMASIFKSKTIKLHCIDPGAPIRVTGSDSPESEFAVLMPMRVADPVLSV